jgi:hypothetical protein
MRGASEHQLAPMNLQRALAADPPGISVRSRFFFRQWRPLVAEGLLRSCARSRKPILAFQGVDASEFALIGCDQDVPQRQGVRGDQQIVAADRSAPPFEIGAQPGINGIRRGVERQDFQGGKHSLDASGQTLCLSLHSPETQLGRHDDAGRDLSLADLAKALSNPSTRMVD